MSAQTSKITKHDGHSDTAGQLSTPGTCAISKLSTEILLIIFSLNGHADACYIDRDIGVDEILHPIVPMAALTTTRYSSQVCQQWRAILLDSPAIWATGLDLQCFDQQNDEWREEVLKRTGNRVLTIIGDLYENMPSVKFFLKLVSTEWSRIRRMFVCDRGGVSGFETEVWNALQQASPALEWLHLDVSFENIDLDLDLETPFFANNAPRLRGIQFDRIFMRPDQTWFQNLQHISDLDIAWFTIAELLLALGHMPQLETLDLCGAAFHEDDNAEVNFSTVVLPRLNRLKANCDLIIFTPVLRRLRTATNCSLHLSPIWDIPVGEDSQIEDLGKALSTFFQQWTTEEIFSLSYVQVGASFSIHSPKWDVNTCVEINGSYEILDWPGLPGLILDALAEKSFSTVILTIFLHFPPPAKSILSFLEKFPKLESITCDLKTLDSLNNLMDSHDPERSILLPSMVQIYLLLGKQEDPNPLSNFLSLRQRLDVPIKYLVLCCGPSFTGNLQVFTALARTFNLEIVLDSEKGGFMNTYIDLSFLAWLEDHQL
ncbi:hypothetical protein JR316_0003959 [Psilocybe cubensis]|uniref:F-box domain-containing protein n=2 Tax=Psilocybe cubensis TaxID=181762 RepID=A0A8H7Y316_PSICU|nr:hypothetical protein JR316_0003959 [Psilocybe cubensis]KAH9484477.1 hypothetical protein JR316_0003959 [Psilocybe cubensis]